MSGGGGDRGLSAGATVRLSEARREALLGRLAAAYTADEVDAQEYERRVEGLLNAGTEAEADALVADLAAVGSPAAGSAAASAAGSAVTSAARGRRRGHAEAPAPHPSWEPTGERFRDPRSGRVMRVWVDATGARHYVPDEPG